MKYIDSEKLIAEIERRKEEIERSIQVGSKKIQKSGLNRLSELELIKTFITSLQQEKNCIFGNIPSEDTCSFCSAYCSLRVPKTKVSTSTEIAIPSGQAENLTFEEYFRGVLEINNGIENDIDNLVKLHAPELLKLARKQEQPEVDLEAEIDKMIRSVFYDLNGIAIAGSSEYTDVEAMVYIARHFYELGLNARKEE